MFHSNAWTYTNGQVDGINISIPDFQGFFVLYFRPPQPDRIFPHRNCGEDRCISEPHTRRMDERLRAASKPSSPIEWPGHGLSDEGWRTEEGQRGVFQSPNEAGNFSEIPEKITVQRSRSSRSRIIPQGNGTSTANLTSKSNLQRL